LKRIGFLHFLAPYHSFKGILLSIVLLGLAQPPAYAVRVATLYEASVAVPDQTPGNRSAALREILQQVVIKVSGQGVLPEGLLQATVRIQDLVEQFGYETRQEEQHRQVYLWAKLNTTGVKQLIRQVGLPVWPEERPSTLMWLAVDDENGQQVIAEDSTHPVLAGINEAAGKRGLPVVFPLMDLSESRLVDYGKLASLDPLVLAPISEKYASQFGLMGHIQQMDKNNWRARWRVAGQDEEILVTPAGPLSDVLAAAIDPLASRIARQFSSFSHRDSPQYIDVTIDDIRGAADYAKGMKYLESLSPVTQVDVTGVNGQKVNFRLHTRADIASVLQVISLGRVLYARDTVDRLVFGLNP